MARRLTTDQVNVLNIGLMIVSAVLAFVVPFELFLFAYAVLGPLHYLTEISWLHDRKYFTVRDRDYLLFVVLGLLAAADYFASSESFELATSIGIAGVGGALILTSITGTARRIIAALVLVGLILFLRTGEMWQLLFAVFLPSVIHVSIFTGLFILYGSLKSRSVSGYISFAVFIACSLCFFLLAIPGVTMELGTYVRSSYSEISSLNAALIQLFGLGSTDTAVDPLGPSFAALAVARFLAFAYTYHYLNWFSKTSIIQWHNISRARLASIVVLWVASLALYAYDYPTGLAALLVLSYLHVYLELPLNGRSLIGIGQELRRFASPPARPS
jgi:hypothetical protein